MLMVQKSDKRKKGKTVDMVNLSHAYALPETNSKFAPESGCLEYDPFLLGPGWMLVSGSQGTSWKLFLKRNRSWKKSPVWYGIFLPPHVYRFFKKTSQRFQRIKGLFSEAISRWNHWFTLETWFSTSWLLRWKSEFGNNTKKFNTRNVYCKYVNPASLWR